jgi:hypothetical protein
MFLGSITYLVYFLLAIFALFIVIGFFTLIWFIIIEIIKCHKRRIKALNANLNVGVIENNNLKTQLLDQP